MFQVISVKEAKEKIISSLITHTKNLKTERVYFANSFRRVAAENLSAPMDLPPFSRSTVDGFAVKADDTFGASESLPAILEKVEKISMGAQPSRELTEDKTMEIPTGGMLPAGADAVVMLEKVEIFDESTVAVNAGVAPGENVIFQGDDIQTGAQFLSKGHRIREQDIGAFAALGINEVLVYKEPIVGIVSTGDELVSPDQKLTVGKVRDINSWALKAAVEKNGATPKLYGIIPDNKENFINTISQASLECDIIIISGGSSVGARDLTADVINKLSDPGVIFHGVSVKPGKPTIFGVVNDKPIFGLSGNPVSALVTFDLFVKQTINFISGFIQSSVYKEHSIKARLTRNISSTGGREDYIRVSIQPNNDGPPDAIPVLGESGLIFTLVEADGMICIPQNQEGFSAGEFVEVTIS